MRALGLDHGSVRVGCALSDPTGTLVTPLESVDGSDTGAIGRLVEEKGAEVVVVGLPVSLSGEEGPQAREAREYGESLARELPVPVEFYDERFTSRMADRTRRDSGARADRDSIAAAHMLEGFLASRTVREESS